MTNPTVSPAQILRSEAARLRASASSAEAAADFYADARAVQDREWAAMARLGADELDAAAELIDGGGEG